MVKKLWFSLIEKQYKIYTLFWIRIGLMPWIIDTYVKTIKLYYVYLPEQKKHILLKFKQGVVHALNIRVKNISKQTKPVFDSYKDNLEDMIDNNIDNRVPSKNNFLWPLKLSAPAFQLKRAILPLFWLFGNTSSATSSKSNNSNIFLLENLLSKLLLSIMLYDPLNLLLNSNNRGL